MINGTSTNRWTILSNDFGNSMFYQETTGINDDNDIKFVLIDI